MTPARDPKQRENHEKICFSSFFQGIVGQNPFQNLRRSRPIILNRSQPPPTLPDPFYIDFIFFSIFLKKNCLSFLSICYIFNIFSALEAPGPVPTCRSHFSAQTRVIESFWNPQGTSFVTKQCPKCIAKIYAKSRHKKKSGDCTSGIHRAEERSCLNSRKVIYCCHEIQPIHGFLSSARWSKCTSLQQSNKRLLANWKTPSAWPWLKILEPGIIIPR